MMFSKNLSVIKYSFIFLIIVSCSRNDDSSNNGSSNNPPDNFALLEIRNNAIDISLSPQFSWGRAADSDGDSVTYNLLLEVGDGKPNNVLASGLQTTDFTVNTSLEINTLYSWQVIASDGNGGTTNSEVFSFTTRNNQPPEAFNLLETPNGAMNIALNPTLIWDNAIDSDGDTITYNLLLDEGNQNPSTIIADNLQQTTFEITENLDHNTTYYWQVIALDNQGNSTASEIFSFTTRLFRETLVTSEAQFSTRTEHSLIEFNGKLWVIGGVSFSSDVNRGLLNDVWSSTDGLTWSEEVSNNSNTSFTPRASHTTVVFQDKIWVIGGSGVNSLLNDVWSSPDGVNWSMETPDAGFTRFSHTSIIYNNKIWVMGGEDESLAFNDVWSSSDGINWNLITNDASFAPRILHSSVVFQEKMWIIGGIGTGFGELNDVWSSSDGVNWSLETVNADFSPRRGHSSAVYKNRLWVIAGVSNNEIWTSKDGITWKQETEIVEFSRRAEQANLVFDDKLWIVGGWMGSLLNDVWFFD